MPTPASQLPDEGTIVSQSIHKTLRDAADSTGRPLQEIEEAVGLPSGWFSKKLTGSKLSCVSVMRAAQYLGVSLDKLMILLDHPETPIVFPAKMPAPSDAWVAAKGLESAFQEKRQKGGSLGRRRVSKDDEE